MRTLTRSAAFAAAMSFGFALAADKSNPDWPCVQKKIESLSVGQIWDGPPVDLAQMRWADDDDTKDLIPTLVNRRVPLADAEAAIKAFAEAQPAADRDARLMLLYAGVFETANGQRKTVIGGLEKYLKAQRSRAADVEKRGLELDEMRAKTGLDDAAEAAIEKAQEAFDWESRIFQERQQNIPVACEVPVIIEHRLYDITKAIRGQMSK